MVPIGELVRGLEGMAEADFTLPRVQAFLEANPVDPASLGPYRLFRATHYTRNLIFRSDLFELMAICWEVGQGSRVHNHHGQRCWMAAAEGRLVVQNYEVVDLDERTGECELKEAGRLVMDAGHPAHVAPELPVHAVLNLAEHGERAVSLHVYSRPYDRCLVYDLAQGRYAEVPLFFDSEYGQPLSVTL
jgi:cysteine dioxygenase